MAEEDSVVVDTTIPSDASIHSENTGADDMTVETASLDTQGKQGSQRILEVLKRIRLSSNLALKYVLHTLLEKPNKTKIHST